jgi:two-component system response regulator NreC
MLVDDHAVLRAGVRMLIGSQADMEVVAEADNRRDALHHAAELRPDVMLLDLTLSDGSSLQTIEQLQALPDSPRVLVLTMHDDPAYVRAALAAGATGYLVKKVREHDLLDAIRAVRRGRMVIDLDDELRTAQVFQSLRSCGSRDVAPQLSERETEVLRLLGRGFTNLAVAEKLALSPKTVATYRARIAEKLGLKTTAEFVQYAVDTGMVTPQHS